MQDVDSAVALREQREEEFWDRRARQSQAGLDPHVYRVCEHDRFDRSMPWLPHMGVNRLVQDLLDSIGDVRGKRVLDLGTGNGFLAVLLAKLGADVVAVDISEAQLDIARQRAQLSDAKVDFRKTSADVLDFPDETFDVVVGAFILHHVHLIPTAKQVRRVMTRGARAAFIETTAFNPLLMFFRQRIIGRMGVPKHGSEDEHPLDKRQIAQLDEIFPGDVQVHCPLLVFARLAPAYIKPLRWSVTMAGCRTIDNLLGLVPGMKRWSYYVTVTMQKR
jgi:ubiquinone/menaquinone biosynthesis C-methylase UbiE